MRDKDYLKKDYKSFKDFLSMAIAKDLEYFVLDSKFTSAFNYRIKRLLDEIKKEGKDDIDFSVLFNTEGEVSLIDANILGNFISNSYVLLIEKYYKNITLEKIVKEVVGGNEKNKRDFIMISCSLMYKVLRELYKDITYKKEIVNRYMLTYKIENYEREDSPVITVILLIMEDVCQYLSINRSTLIDAINAMIVAKKFR